MLGEGSRVLILDLTKDESGIRYHIIPVLAAQAQQHLQEGVGIGIHAHRILNHGELRDQLVVLLQVPGELHHVYSCLGDLVGHFGLPALTLGNARRLACCFPNPRVVGEYG